MAWYTAFNASGGLYQMINATAASMESQIPILGGNMFAISILVPLWIIIFLPLAKFNMSAAFVVSSFTCWMVTVFLMAIQLVNESAFVIFTLLTIASAVLYYMNTRQ